MPAWTPQTQVPSWTPALLARTAWLDPFAPTVGDAIDAYFTADPHGEDVTLAVLRAVGRQDLERLAGPRTLNRAKQDLGLFVAQTLVARFGESNVKTWRKDRAAVTRRNKDTKQLGWVTSYTPHQVVTGGP